MSRLKPSPKLQTPSSRRFIKQTPKLHVVKIFTGLAVGYRKGKNGGSWFARRHDAGMKYTFERLGVADDLGDADGIAVLSFDQAQEAARLWFKRRAQEETGGVVDGSYTIARAMDDYIADRESATRKPKARDRLIVEAHIKPALGCIELNKLTQGKVKTWRDALATAAPRLRTRPGKPQAYREMDASDPDVLRRRQATANRILTVLKAALNHALTESSRVNSNMAWVNVKPFRKVDVPKIRFLSADEVDAMVPACEPSFQALVKAALLTGCRYGELVAMGVGAFDAGKGTVYVADSKNGESRYVDLNGEGIALFAEVTNQRKPKELIFLRSNGKQWKQSEQQRPMDDACESAKLEGVTFHILRHTYASHSLMNGMTIEVLAQQLGHKDTRITMRHYAHLCPTFKQESVRRNAPSFGFAVNKPGPVLVNKAS
jgi:integrase